MADPSEKNTPPAAPTLIYGGTFDPPHAAHAALPVLAAEALGAAALVYVPAGRSPFKREHEQSAPHHRRRMLGLMLDAVRPTTGVELRIDDGEIKRGDGEPSYTIDTARRLRRELGEGTPLRLLLGTDQFFSFEQWKEAQALAALAVPVVMARPPHGREQVERFLREQAPAYLRGAVCVDVPAMDLSSTAVREAIRRGRDVSGSVTPGVLRYAREHGLYD
ncbi:MAG: nicotinate (nicotinamide) nucleotide adenylyltransferase [Planctomycetota bacterium]